MSKSFLLLFFKKEEIFLPPLASTALIAPARQGRVRPISKG
jgi:hypothetical protein